MVLRSVRYIKSKFIDHKYIRLFYTKLKYKLDTDAILFPPESN